MCSGSGVVYTTIIYAVLFTIFGSICYTILYGSIYYTITIYIYGMMVSADDYNFVARNVFVF